MSDVTVIGQSTLVRGTIRGEGDLEIHGRVEGTIEIAGAVTVVAGALVKADVTARAIVVGGSLAGDLTAEEVLRLEEGARVVGDLRAPTIGIAEGALFRGNVETNVDEEAPAATRERVATARPERSTPARAAAPVARPVERPAPTPARPAVAEKAASPAREPARTVTRVVPVATAARAPAERRPAAVAAAPAPSAVASSPAPVVSPPSVPESAAPPSAPPPPAEESAPSSEERAAAPDPVMPALRKGAKAAIKKKTR